MISDLLLLKAPLKWQIGIDLKGRDEEIRTLTHCSQIRSSRSPLFYRHLPTITLSHSCTLTYRP